MLDGCRWSPPERQLMGRVGAPATSAVFKRPRKGLSHGGSSWALGHARLSQSCLEENASGTPSTWGGKPRPMQGEGHIDRKHLCSGRESGQALFYICVFSFQFIQTQYSGEIKYIINLKLPNQIHKW